MDKAAAVKLHERAEHEGLQAGTICIPTPMVVGERYVIADGPCGFAWVNVKAVGPGLAFINGLKKAGLASADINSFDPEVVWKRDSYYKGYTYWVYHFNQSMEKKKAMAVKMATILQGEGIEATAMSRLD